MESESKAFLGRGWKFPISFSKARGGVEMVEGETDIRESLGILMRTRLYERVMSDYGTTIHDMVFQPMNLGMLRLAEELFRAAILKHEPRIIVESLSFQTDAILNGVLRITVEYTIIASNTRSNMVYPFYFNEGTDVQQLISSTNERALSA